MATEIEAKVRVTDPAAVVRHLVALGAQYGGSWLQTDTFFDHPDRSLMRTDSALRLRHSRPLDPTASRIGESSELTYKGAREATRLKVRPEHEVAVPDAAAMTAILRNLRFTEAFCYEKRRRTWRLGAAEVTLDDVPRLGLFVEVEAASEDEVDRLLDALGFAGQPRITDSYTRMLAAVLGPDSDGARVHFEDTRA